MIDEDGGRAVFNIDGQPVVVEVPPAAVNGPITLTASITNFSPPGVRGPVFELGPAGTKFAHPVTVLLPGPDSGTGPIHPRYSLVTRSSNEPWRRIEGKLRADGMVAGTVEHFSLFGVIADPGAVGHAGPRKGTIFHAGSVTLTASQPIDLRSMTVSEETLHLLAKSFDGNQESVDFTLTGLRPDTTIHAFDGSLANDITFQTGSTGTGSFTQDLSADSSSVWLQDAGGSIFISADDPSGCRSVGRWEASTRTCWLGGSTATLSTNPLTEQLEITTSDTTLDCRTVDSNFVLTGDSVTLNSQGLNGPAVVTTAGISRPSIRHCTIKARDTGVLVNPLAATGDVSPSQARIEQNVISTETRFLPGVWLKGADSATVRNNDYSGPSAIFLDDASFGTVGSNYLESHWGIDVSSGTSHHEISDNDYVAVDFGTVTAAIAAFGVRIGDLSAESTITDNELVGFTAGVSKSVGIFVRGESPLDQGAPVPNTYRENEIRGADIGIRIQENGRAEAFVHNRLNSNLEHALQYGSPGPVPTDGSGAPIPAHFRFFHNDVVFNGVPQVDSTVALELSGGSVPIPGSRLGGNFWGNSCSDGPPYFVAGGDDSNRADVVDEAPYAVPVAEFSDVDFGSTPTQFTHLAAPGCQDTDGDSFADFEEFRGIAAVDADTGAPLGFLDLPALGADPFTPDIFVEVDYIDAPATKPTPSAYTEVIDSFAQQGINLHVDLGTAAPGTQLDLGGGNALPDIDVIARTDLRAGGSASGLTFRDTEAIRRNNFDPARRAGFFYVMAVRGTSSKGESAVMLAEAVSAGADSVKMTDIGSPSLTGGVAEVDGDRFTYSNFDFQSRSLVGIPTDTSDPDAINSNHAAMVRVSMPGGIGGSAQTQHDIFLAWDYHPDFKVGREARTFMHELGHALGLQHGGDDNSNFKPNYPSVMSYTWGGLWVDTCSDPPDELDFSNGSRTIVLDENGLDEGVGVPGLPHSWAFALSGTPNNANAMACIDPGTPVDWDQNNIVVGTPARDLNLDGDTVDLLEDHDDWANLDFYDRTKAGLLLATRSEDEDLFDRFAVQEAFVPIEVQVKPGTDQTPPINLKSRGRIPVAFISDSAFDASTAIQVDARFGAPGRGAEPEMCSLEDVNGDGLFDLVCHFLQQSSNLREDSAVAGAFVRTDIGTRVGALVEVRIVP